MPTVPYRRGLPIIVLLSLVVLSCSRNADTGVAVHTVARADFRNSLNVEGVVESVSSATVVCPNYADGLITFLIEDGTYVKEGDIVCVLEDSNIEDNYETITLQLETAEANRAKVAADLNMQYALLEAQVRNNEAETQIARLDSVQLQFASPNQRKIKELELESVSIVKAKLEENLKSLAIINASELRKLDLNIQRLASRVQQAKENLEGLTLKAPKGGMAVHSEYMLERERKVHEGDAVWNGMPLVQIPDMSQMKVVMSVTERDYKQISLNDTIEYTFSAMPGNRAWGKITYKSPVGQQYKKGSRVKFFEIQASVDSMDVIPEPGLSANCDIMLREIKDTIVVPQVAVFDEDSIKVVFVRNKRGFEMRQVETGASSPRQTIIAEGLKPGEVVAIIRPEPSKVKDTVYLPRKEAQTENKADENEDNSEAVDSTAALTETK